MARTLEHSGNRRDRECAAGVPNQGLGPSPGDRVLTGTFRDAYPAAIGTSDHIQLSSRLDREAGTPEHRRQDWRLRVDQ